MILLVEDERFVREVMGQVLRAAGYRVVVSENATQARRAFRLHGGEIQLLITDVIMPGENGRKLASGLRARKYQLPTLFRLTIFESGQAQCFLRNLRQRAHL